MYIQIKRIRVILFFLIFVPSKDFAQEVMKLSFKLTEIPNIYVKPKQPFEITVESNSAVTMSYSPQIVGSLKINSSNIINYEPDKEDLQPISVSLFLNTDTFSFKIIPVFYNGTSSSFLPYGVGDAIDATNFYKVIIDSTDVNNKELIIEGKEILFDNSSSNPFNNLSFKEEEIKYPYKKVSIYADKLVIKSRVWFPGVKLQIKAKEIIFDALLSKPSIEITPFQSNTPISISTMTLGENGSKCDEMKVYYQNIFFKNFPNGTTNPTCFLARGGEGLAAPFGKDGIPYPKLNPISSFTTIAVQPTNSSCRNNAVYVTSVATGIPNDPRNSSLVHIWFNKKATSSYEQHYGSPREGDIRTVGCEYQQWAQIDPYNETFTVATKESAKPIIGGIPGKGGAGGLIISNQDLKKYVSVRQGLDGKKDDIRKSGLIDGPKQIYSYNFDDVNQKNNEGYQEWGYPEEIILKPLPNNNIDMPAGEFKIEANSSDKYKSIRYAKYAIKQADDLFRFGYVDSASSIYNVYLKNFFNTSCSDCSVDELLDYKNLEYNVRINQNKILANLDFYGNPNNWVPKLNIVLNYSLYKVSLENNFQLISRAIYLLSELKRNNTVNDNLKSLLSNLSTSNTDYQFQIENLTLKEIPELERSMGLINTYMNMLDVRLRKVEAEINAQADGIIKEKERKAKQKAFFKTLTGIAKVIPVYQPALGIAATAIETIALKDGDNSIGSTISYLSANYSEMKNNQAIIKNNLNDALQKAKNSSGDISISEINKNKEAIFKNLGPVIETMDGILKRTAYKSMPADAFEIEVARLKEENVEYRGLVDSMTHLVTLNKNITDKIIKVSSEITHVSGLLQNSISATLAIKTELSSDKPISHNTLTMLEKVKDDALNTILYYQYLFAKSYEYFTLKQYKGYEKTAPLLVTLPTIVGDLNYDNIYNAIKTIYMSEVNSTIESSISGLNTFYNPIPEQREQTFEISKDDVDLINKHDTLKINLFRNFNYNVLRKKLSAYDDILIKDIKIIPVFDNSAAEIYKNASFAKTSIIVEHTGFSKRYTDDKSYNFIHLKGENNKPRSWELSHDFKNDNHEIYVQPDRTYLELLCEYINKETSDICKNNIKSDVGYDSDLWIYKDDNQEHGAGISLSKLSLTITFSGIKQNKFFVKKYCVILQ